jgi:hypothetical protein
MHRKAEEVEKTANDDDDGSQVLVHRLGNISNGVSLFGVVL